jgi:hypothetical protein
MAADTGGSFHCTGKRPARARDRTTQHAAKARCRPRKPGMHRPRRSSHLIFVRRLHPSPAACSTLFRSPGTPDPTVQALAIELERLRPVGTATAQAASMPTRTAATSPQLDACADGRARGGTPPRRPFERVH